MLRSMLVSRAAVVSSLFLAFAFTISNPAFAYDVSFTGSNSGGALTPWSGTISGHTDVIAYTEGGDGSRYWASEAVLVVNPPIPEENWGPLTGRHAMYQIIQWIVDHFVCAYYPPNPPAIGALTNYNFTHAATATSATYGITVSGSGVSSTLPLPAFTGNVAVIDNLPFSYCLNQYRVTGTVSPIGPGFAHAAGTAVLPLQDGTDLVFTLDGMYAFDPTLILPAPYSFELDGSFELTLNEPQTWSVHSTYIERGEHSTSVDPTEVAAAPPIAFPNPFNRVLTLRFAMPQDGHASVSIVGISGQEVVRLCDGERGAGTQEIVWSGGDRHGAQVPSGTYYAKFDLAGVRTTRMLTLLR